MSACKDLLRYGWLGAALAWMCAGCATPKEGSSIPWNKPASWESGSPLPVEILQNQ